MALVSGSSDEQLRRTLGSAALRDEALLHLGSTEGVFGGWVHRTSHDRFEMVMQRAGIVGQASWCCTSWYKPSGTFFLAQPAPTLALGSGCGTSSAVGQEEAACAAAQADRRRRQTPFRFEYEEFGPDGYFRLVHNPALD